jgi:hypothetical protein
MNDERLKKSRRRQLLERAARPHHAGSLHAPSISTVWGTDGVPRSLR